MYLRSGLRKLILNVDELSQRPQNVWVSTALSHLKSMSIPFAFADSALGVPLPANTMALIKLPAPDFVPASATIENILPLCADFSQRLRFLESLRALHFACNDASADHRATRSHSGLPVFSVRSLGNRIYFDPNLRLLFRLGNRPAEVVFHLQNVVDAVSYRTGDRVFVAVACPEVSIYEVSLNSFELLGTVKLKHSGGSFFSKTQAFSASRLAFVDSTLLCLSPCASRLYICPSADVSAPCQVLDFSLSSISTIRASLGIGSQLSFDSSAGFSPLLDEICRIGEVSLFDIEDTVSANALLPLMGPVCNELDVASKILSPHVLSYGRVGVSFSVPPEQVKDFPVQCIEFECIGSAIISSSNADTAPKRLDLQWETEYNPQWDAAARRFQRDLLYKCDKPFHCELDAWLGTSFLHVRYGTVHKVTKGLELQRHRFTVPLRFADSEQFPSTVHISLP
eukprot:ANDGO_00507.mRNA.1 hypothetical protein